MRKLIALLTDTFNRLKFIYARMVIAKSGLFDAEWYLSEYPDVAHSKINPAGHYLRFGGFEGRDPSPNFSSQWYLETYQDVNSANKNPLLHYLQHGRNEGRKIKSLKQIRLAEIEETLRWVESSVNQFFINYYRDEHKEIHLPMWKNHPLPDLIIIGAQRSGTTSLHHYLSQHPQLEPAIIKEVHYFDSNYHKGHDWYRAHFPLEKYSDKQHKFFEASPLYIFNPLVPKRIAELVPEVKLIAILRNPTERAISHYFHEKKHGTEILPIMAALKAEEERLAPILRNDDFNNYFFIHNTYKSRGHYCEQLTRYLKYFNPENFLVINSERFFKYPEKTLHKIYDFMGVENEILLKDPKPLNVSINRIEVAQPVYDYLNNYYFHYNQDLYALTGENYQWEF